MSGEYWQVECLECHRKVRLPNPQRVCGICLWYDSWATPHE